MPGQDQKMNYFLSWCFPNILLEHVGNTKGSHTFLLVYHYMKFNNFSVPLYFLYLNKKGEIGKTGLTAGISYIMLPAMLHIIQYICHTFYLFFNILILFYVSIFH
jgi:hypothetical protein